VTTKKPKRPSMVDRLAARLYPEGTIDHAIQRKWFVKVVGPAIRRAVQEAYDHGWDDGSVGGNCTENWNRLARKYGMKEVK